MDANPDKADLSALKIDRKSKAKVPGWWKRWLHLLWLVVPIVGYLAYQVAIEKARPSVSVRTARVEFLSETDASVDLVATGYVVAQVKAAVASKATGRLEVLNFEEGDRVRAGEVIAELDNEDIRAELEIAEANLRLARADSVAAELHYRRQERLRLSGYTTDEAVENATAAYLGAAARVEAAAAMVKAARVALDNTIIKAPFAGTVLTKHADVGEMVAPFASASSSKGAVVTIADMSSLQVEADVSESNIQRVKPGGACRIILDAYPAITYLGKVNKIVPTADRARATVMVKIAFDRLDERVLPEMSARVSFLPEAGDEKTAEPVLAAPQTAVTMREGQPIVFVVENGAVRAVSVRIGRNLGEVVEIIEGLEAGAEVVLSPAGNMKSGDKIEISQ